tara:strand:- start:231 stop:416 length:186 start_codon:yes stop_codon:yes gene_type:complete
MLSLGGKLRRPYFGIFINFEVELRESWVLVYLNIILIAREGKAKYNLCLYKYHPNSKGARE